MKSLRAKAKPKPGRTRGWPRGLWAQVGLLPDEGSFATRCSQARRRPRLSLWAGELVGSEGQGAGAADNAASIVARSSATPTKTPFGKWPAPTFTPTTLPSAETIAAPLMLAVRNPGSS